MLKTIIILGTIVMISYQLIYYGYSDVIAMPSISKEIRLDVSNGYDPKFNWYNTNGSLAIIDDGRVTFTGSDRTNVYQDAVSIISIKAKELELYTKVRFEINEYSNYPKDEFAVFATSDVVTYKGHEFGFVLPENDRVLYAYIQSPEIEGFFVWKPIAYVSNEHIYELKVEYDKDAENLRFYIDDALVWDTKFVDLSGSRMHLALVSHKLSYDSIDISSNKMIIYETYLSSEL